MDKSFRDAGKPILRREVQPPLKQNTGIGVMLVASGAMFFAVASSAVILRSQMPAARHCPRMSQPAPAPQVVEAVPVELVEMPAEEAQQDLEALQRCSEPDYHENSDGTVSVRFDLCSPAAE